LEFLSPSDGCYKTGGMKCRRYNQIVIKYDVCLGEKTKKQKECLENKTE